MGYHPVTPFGRTVDAVLIQRQNQLQAASERMPAASSQLEPAKPVSKWNVLRDLAVARHHFGLSDRDLSVLQALLSFWSGTELPADRALVIHPSNQTICDRLNGMANSTMRRYLARLVDAGLLLRRDSPNGKRYARRYGGEKVAYGFDLSPLRQRAREIEMAAEDVRAEEFRLKRLRETVSLMRRDLAGLAEFGLSLRPDLPLWLEACLKKALQPDPRHRYTVLSEFWHDLNHPNPRLEARLEQQPLLQKDPIRFWQLLAVLLLLLNLLQLLL